MSKPTEGQVVEVVTQAGMRSAVVVRPWNGDVAEVARKLGVSEDEVEALHGMRATVTVTYESGDGMPSPFTVSNMEYDANGQREGTWHYLEDMQ